MIKLKKATPLSRALRASSESISAIAIDHGFYDHSHFVKHFKAFTGLTPSDYRKRWSGTHPQ